MSDKPTQRDRSASARLQRGRPHFFAECEVCDWFDSGEGTTRADNARAAAKRHAQSTGHRIYMERTMISYFNREPGS